MKIEHLIKSEHYILQPDEEMEEDQIKIERNFHKTLMRQEF